MEEKKKILSAVSLYHALDDGVISVIPLLFPVFKVLFDLSYTQIGLITGGGLLVTLIGQLYLGHISDRKNFKIMLSGGRRSSWSTSATNAPVATSSAELVARAMWPFSVRKTALTRRSARAASSMMRRT